MYNYALCIIVLYVVSLDNCNFVNISIEIPDWKPS